mmetsp:Transcript_85641/g.173864  ORF Transcript_85641/g.173864 Transcript_85641/m.173864 type:complete len:88 (-) Transcript_85641:676-939(-)
MQHQTFFGLAQLPAQGSPSEQSKGGGVVDGNVTVVDVVVDAVDVVDVVDVDDGGTVVAHPTYSCVQHQALLSKAHICCQLSNPTWQS